MMGNHAEHVAVIFALMSMRAVWVPVNPRLRGRPLEFQIETADPHLCLADGELAAGARGAAAGLGVEVWPPDLSCRSGPAGLGFDPDPDEAPQAGDVIAIMFTSGTTGPPKGVMVTDRMLRTAAASAVVVSDSGPGDSFLVWEPLCHIGGAQMLVVPLLADVTLALLAGFSASRFWQQAARMQATHIHHLGGILAILLSREPDPDERSHQVGCSWGGGITPAIWTEAEARFGLRVRECYGLTELSSIVTANLDGPGHGVGRALPDFEITVQDPDGQPCPPGQAGEIVVRSRPAGLITPGYFRNPEATGRSRRGDWWRTGDLGFLRGADLHFIGRAGDSIRHRGENVSAWEVESVVNTHPAVQESAIVGIPASHGEQDLAAYVTVTGPAPLSAAELITWCGDRLAAYQVPQHVIVVESFARTPSLRIDKSALPPVEA
jgi:carnitine-CoA ligase